MPKDIILNEELDLKIVDGDFAVSESTYQHQQLLLYAEKGEFKANPKVGVGSKRYLESEKPDDYAREIRHQFINDGMEVESIEISEHLEVGVDAYYEV